MDILAARVRSLRESKDWTQEDLARESGLKRPHISLIETKERVPGADTLIKLADALGTNTDYLLGRVNFSGPCMLPEQFNDLSHDPNFTQLAAAWDGLSDTDRKAFSHAIRSLAELRRQQARGEE